MSPLQEFEEDLKELAKYQPTARRIFLTGANPFAMNYEKLAERALLVHDYFVECQTIAMFSGDDSTLLLANKGYTARITNFHKEFTDTHISIC